jgi:hypothetical protein
MSPVAVASIVFICVFGSALLSLYLRTVPKCHLGKDSAEVVTLGTSVIAVLAAVVLGLLIDSAAASYDGIKKEATQTALKFVQLDRALAHYGPETTDTRVLVRDVLASLIEVIFHDGGSGLTKLDVPERRAKIEETRHELRNLAPHNDVQRSYQSHALELINAIAEIRWVVIVEGEGTIPRPLLVVLVLWLAVIFLGFGLLTPTNGTAVAIFFAWALSFSSAILLIEEMNRPLEGLMQISSTLLRNALAHLGQ